MDQGGERQLHRHHVDGPRLGYAAQGVHAHFAELHIFCLDNCPVPVKDIAGFKADAVAPWLGQVWPRPGPNVQVGEVAKKLDVTVQRSNVKGIDYGIRQRLVVRLISVQCVVKGLFVEGCKCRIASMIIASTEMIPTEYSEPEHNKE